MNPETIAEQIYVKYPEMQPYVGGGYRPSAPWSILLIGESFYQEKKEGTTQHLCPDTWYQGDHTGKIQNDWINTQKIISDNIPAWFPNKAHSIYKRSFVEINNSGPKFHDAREIAQYLSFVNYFHRPAEKEGGSICVHTIDREVAELVLLNNIKKLKPKLIAFVSRKAFQHFNIDKLKEYDCSVISTPHPGCVWWNRKSKKWGGIKGCEVLSKAVSLLGWSGIKKNVYEAE